MTFRSIAGWVLSGLMCSSAILAVAGVWGFIGGETVGQLLLTFLVIGVATIGLSYVTTTFFENKGLK